jgi:hypothetical protein
MHGQLQHYITQPLEVWKTSVAALKAKGFPGFIQQRRAV